MLTANTDQIHLGIIDLSHTHIASMVPLDQKTLNKYRCGAGPAKSYKMIRLPS